MFFLFQVLKNKCCQILYDVNENSRKKRKINRRQLIVLNFEGRKKKSIMKKKTQKFYPTTILLLEWRRLSPYFTVTSRCARDSKRYKIKKYPLKQINTMI